jgi:hypothetical protein
MPNDSRSDRSRANSPRAGANRPATTQRAIATGRGAEPTEPVDPWASGNPIPLRAVLAILGTAVCLVLLLSFKTPDLAPPTSLGLGDPNAGGGGGAATGNGGAVVTTPSPVRGAGGTPGSTPDASGALSSRTEDVTGPAEQTPFGDVQVEVKLVAGKVADVIALQLPSDRRRSSEISQYAAPILHDEAIQAQSAQIQGVSGATYTSGGYERSLQAALDQANSS